MFSRLMYRRVCVRTATRLALEDIGEQRSPKYAPAMIAPAATLTSTCPLFARTMRITPMVPAVPKEEPSRKDMMELRIKADSTKNCSLKYEMP